MRARCIPNLSQVAVPALSLVSPFLGLTTFSIFHRFPWPLSPFWFYSNFSSSFPSHDPPLSSFCSFHIFILPFTFTCSFPFAFSRRPSSFRLVVQFVLSSSSFLCPVLLGLLPSFFIPFPRKGIFECWGFHDGRKGVYERKTGHSTRRIRERRLYWTQEDESSVEFLGGICSPERSEDRKDWCPVSCPGSPFPIDWRRTTEKKGEKRSRTPLVSGMDYGIGWNSGPESPPCLF